MDGNEFIVAMTSLYPPPPTLVGGALPITQQGEVMFHTTGPGPSIRGEGDDNVIYRPGMGEYPRR